MNNFPKTFHADFLKTKYVAIYAKRRIQLNYKDGSGIAVEHTHIL